MNHHQQLLHSIRRPDGSWQQVGDVGGQIHVPGPVRAVAAAGSGNGDVQFVFVTEDGHLWHTIRYAAGAGSWAPLGDVEGQIHVPGPVRAVAAAAAGDGDVQVIFTTEDGRLWHTIRYANGSWQPTGEVAGQIGPTGPARSVAAAGAGDGSVQFLIGTGEPPATPCGDLDIDVQVKIRGR